MTELAERDRELVAIGASIGSNCLPCIAFHVGKAREVGFSEAEIEAAIVLAEEIRAVPASLVGNTARANLQSESANPRELSSGKETGKCACGDPLQEFPSRDSASS